MAATNWFRKNQRKLLGVLVVVLMVIWGIGPAADMLVPKPPVGEIFGENVSQEKFNDAVIRWARVFFRDSKEPVAELVWKQMAIIKRADDMGVYVTNEELTQEIQNWFPESRQMGREGYRRLIGRVFRMTAHQFEQTVREYLLAQKLRFFLRDSIKISSNEALQRYVKENEKIKIKYATLQARDFIDSVEIEEKEIRSFYDEHSDTFPNSGEGKWGYKEPEKVKLEYIMARNDRLSNQITVPDEKMREYYEAKKDLMFKKETEAIPAEDKTPEGEKADDTTVVEYKPFEEVKEQISNTLLFKEIDSLANKLIGEADNSIYENIDEGGVLDLSKLADKHGLSYVIPTNRDNGTNYFTQDELQNMIIGLEKFPQLVFEREIDDPSPPLNSMEGKLIFRVIERTPPQSRSFEDIHDKVAEDFRYEKAFRKAQSLAEKCLEQIDQTSFDEGIKSIEDEAGELQITETDYFNRPGIFGESNYVTVLGEDRPKLASVGFDLKVGKATSVSESKGESICYVVMLEDRKKADSEKFEEEKDLIMQKFLIEKQLAFLTEWESWISTKTRLGKKRS